MEKVENRRRALAFDALLLAMLALLQQLGSAAASTPGSNCTRRCGNIKIPYPFGIELGCYHSAGFNLTCKNSSNGQGHGHGHGHGPPQLFLGDGTVQVLEISVPLGTVRINSRRMGETTGQGTWNGTWGSGLPHGGPFFLSESCSNSIVVVGCDLQLDLWGGSDNNLLGSCIASCPEGYDGGDVVGPWLGYCAGVGCCQANIILGYSVYDIHIYNISNNYDAGFGYSVYIADGIFNYTDVMQLGNTPEALPATLDWVINNNWSCPVSGTAPECRSAHSNCTKSAALGHPGYLCNCSRGYEGNPYVLHGCQDIDECRYPDIYHCYGLCENTEGGFICQCPTGYVGNASVQNGCKDINECENPEAHSCYGTCLNFLGSFYCQCPNGTYGNPFTNGGCIAIKKSFTGLKIMLGVGGGTSILLLTFGGPFIMHKIKQQKVKRMRANFFKQNHGILLRQLISRNANISERMIITLKDLEKATNNFDRDRVIGGGGHGIVFKGNLDLHVVAIKKSKIVVQREIDEFINEVVVLSQVNHRNVVKLLGCCLETEVPLLVYEFIPNGTLSHHLHVEGLKTLSWDDRMRIALEVAKALSYLHSAATMPIFHRDIKSSNILLNDSLTAKVSDFGASRYIPIDQTGVSTDIQGTIGYLDPTYYTTGRLTDKSDVFSFGVVLLELLTRKKPSLYRCDNGDGIVSHFASLLIAGKLVDIIDPQVMEEQDGEILEVATLAALCTKLKGEDRPTMREVEMTLENLLVNKKRFPDNMSPRRYGHNQTENHYTPHEWVTNEASRQYIVEEGILLSATYPR